LDRHDDDAAKVNHAAEMIGMALDATLANMLPTFIEKYGVDDELATGYLEGGRQHRRGTCGACRGNGCERVSVD
jgi:hypothetical protein